MLTAYPTEVVEAAGVVLSKLRGGTVETCHLVHAGWNVAGFALGVALPCEHAPVMTSCSLKECCTEADLIECLDGVCSVQSVGAGFDWSSVALLVLQLLKQWLDNRNK